MIFQTYPKTPLMQKLYLPSGAKHITAYVIMHLNTKTLDYLITYMDRFFYFYLNFLTTKTC
jgi:hypothetical protein